MTTRLYYTDALLRSFDAIVVAAETTDGAVHVVLDQTAFYPTSGGQPFDTGTLGGARVSNVIDRDDGVIVHVVDQPLAIGSRVAGTIDWERRFDHMQQHTGQHVLSAAFDRLLDARTESFHLGTSSASIDIAREVSAAGIARVEAEANRVVWDDRPVSIRFVSAEEAAALPLRKEPARSGPLRLIDVAEFDLSACGGTHVARTGAIGVIAISGWERFRGGSRVEFLCGRRALARFDEWRDAFAHARRLLSVAPADLGATIERLQGDIKTLQRTVRGTQEQLAVHEARALLEQGHRVGDRLVIADAREGWDAAGLKALAAAAASGEPSAAIALFNRATPALAVIARGATGGIDAAAVLKAMVTRFGGKGGGKPDLAQGGGLVAGADELLDYARQLLSA
jgi:alanyl-tRNA synthetase